MTLTEQLIGKNLCSFFVLHNYRVVVETTCNVKWFINWWKTILMILWTYGRIVGLWSDTLFHGIITIRATITRVALEFETVISSFDTYWFRDYVLRLAQRLFPFRICGSTINTFHILHLFLHHWCLYSVKDAALFRRLFFLSVFVWICRFQPHRLFFYHGQGRVVSNFASYSLAGYTQMLIIGILLLNCHHHWLLWHDALAILDLGW